MTRFAPIFSKLQTVFFPVISPEDQAKTGGNFENIISQLSSKACLIPINPRFCTSNCIWAREIEPSSIGPQYQDASRGYEHLKFRYLNQCITRSNWNSGRYLPALMTSWNGPRTHDRPRPCDPHARNTQSLKEGRKSRRPPSQTPLYSIKIKQRGR